MEVVAHQLKFGIDGVVDTYDIFTDIGWLRDRRNILACAKVWLWKRSRIQFKYRIRVEQTVAVIVLHLGNGLSRINPLAV